jgi:hypothetical protein
MKSRTVAVENAMFQKRRNFESERARVLSTNDDLSFIELQIENSAIEF